MCSRMGIRRDWYQSNETIILALLIKGASEVKVNFESNTVTVNGIDKGSHSNTSCLTDLGDLSIVLNIEWERFSKNFH